MGVLRAIPILIFPAILYAVLAIPLGAEGMRAAMASPAFAATLPSGAEWVMTNGYAITLFAGACLFVEIIKSARPTNLAMLENGVSFGVFTLALVMFLMLEPFGTMEFFLIMSMLMIDFLAGSIVMIFASRRDAAFVS
ncbi:MAG: hypothetical protein GC206_05465 [Alphaproteobacteria bacterium]|nr:hypothetical protein [Alphaproteobacteria bacterium]